MLIMMENYKWKWKGETNMGNDIEIQLEQAQEEIDDLRSELETAKDEIDVLQEEIDGFDSRLEDAFSDGYQKAIDNMKDKLEEIE